MKIICELCKKEITDDEIHEVDMMTFHEEECLLECFYQNTITYNRKEYEAGMIELEKRLDGR